MNLPTTRRGCIDLYEKRRKSHAKKTKLDMYLGGMICASNDEFKYRKPCGHEIGGENPCLCRLNYVLCNTVICSDAIDETLCKSWDGDLYD